MSTKHTFRICVDTDSAGQPIGASYEVRNLQGECTRIHHLPDPGPFDTVAETYRRIDADICARYGFTRSLFPAG